MECGGTKTAALLERDGAVTRGAFGPANLRLMNDAALLAHLRSVKNKFAAPRLNGVAICMAGCRTERDRARVRAAAAKVWPGVRCRATDDLEPVLMAAGPAKTARVLVVSGTGSCCLGRAPNGKTVRAGGWGHILGDAGSGYDIGLAALRGTLRKFDRDGQWPPLGARMLRALQLNDPDELIDWARNAAKPEIAALAVEVFAAAEAGDKFARWHLTCAGRALAIQASFCARRLVKSGRPIEFILAGSVATKNRELARALRDGWPGAVVKPLTRDAVWGALELARGAATDAASEIGESPNEFLLPPAGPSPTERRNPRSMNLSRLPLNKAVALMIDEETGIGPALRRVRPKIQRAVELVVAAFRRKGRLFYIGAGTSGRLGVLDASECPPTFRTPPELAQAIIAGGATALWRAVEGAEDDAAAGAAAARFRGVGRGDITLGIAASGRTPFVWGALAEAKRRGAKTILLCFNPQLAIPDPIRPDLVIAADTGPEILAGSTRLKCGTATKIILNTLTTLAMARLGKIEGNLMIDVNPSNQKLRARAAGIVGELTGAAPAAARAALEKTGWRVKAALRRLKKSADN